MFLKETYKTWLCIIYVCIVAYDIYIYIFLFIHLYICNVMFYRDHSCHTFHSDLYKLIQQEWLKSQTEFELGNYSMCSVTTTSHEVVGVKLNR